MLRFLPAVLLALPAVAAAQATTMNSGAKQAFTVGDNPTAISQFAITAGTPAITALNDIRILIPATLNASWDITTGALQLGGTGMGNVKPTATFPSSKVMLIHVDFNFTPGQTLTVRGPALMNFSAATSTANLQMSVDGDTNGDVTDSGSKGIGAPAVSSAANQVFRTNNPVTAAAVLTVTEDANNPRITVAGDLRIRIPTGYGMTWDTSIIAPTFGGTAMAKADPAVTYEDADRTLVISVNTAFSTGQTLTINGPAFANFAVSATDNLELETNNQNTVADTDDKTITVAAPPGMVSAAGQSFTVGDPATPIPVITITDSGVASILAATDLKVTIPAAANFTWDTADTTATLGDAGAANVSSAVTYDDGGRTLVLDVTTNFSGGQVLTISGLSYSAFSAGSVPVSLTLEADADAVVDATDTATLSVGAPGLLTLVNQVFTVGDPATPMQLSQVSDDAATPRIKASSDLRLRIPAGFPMAWDAGVTTATIGGAAMGKMSTGVTYEDSDRTAVLDVQTDFAAGDAITVSGLSFSGFTAASAVDQLELEVNNLGTVADLDSGTIQVLADPATLPPPDPGGSSSGSNCGLLGGEVLLVIVAARFRRRRQGVDSGRGRG